MTGAHLPAPPPERTPETREFWDATAAGRLVLAHCDACDTVIWYPKTYCPRCGGLVRVVEARPRAPARSTASASSTGRPGRSREAVPFVVAYVELDEGPRVLTNIVGCEPDQVFIGQSGAGRVRRHGRGQRARTGSRPSTRVTPDAVTRRVAECRDGARTPVVRHDGRGRVAAADRCAGARPQRPDRRLLRQDPGGPGRRRGQGGVAGGRQDALPCRRSATARAGPRRSLLFAYYHHNKRGITLDWEREEARALLESLAASADVVWRRPRASRETADRLRRRPAVADLGARFGAHAASSRRSG